MYGTRKGAQGGKGNGLSRNESVECIFHRREIQSDKSGELNAENWLEGMGQGVARAGNRLPSDSTGRTSINFTGVARRDRTTEPRWNSARSRCLRPRGGREQPFSSLFGSPISASCFLLGNAPGPETKPTRISVIRVNQILSRVVSIVARLASTPRRATSRSFVDFRSSRKTTLLPRSQPSFVPRFFFFFFFFFFN